MADSVLASTIRQLADRMRRAPIPFIAQVSEGDCGAACLAMVLQYCGRRVDSAELRERLATGRDGSNASLLVRVARTYGLRARGVRVEMDAFAYLPKGTILHWNFNHFVVLERSDRTSVSIIDPGIGRRRLTLEEAAKSFTGVAVLAESVSAAREALNEGFAFSRQLYRGELAAERPRLQKIVVTSLFLQVLSLALPMMTGLLIDQVIPHSDRNLLIMTVIWATVIVGFFFLATLLRGRLLLNLRTAIDARITTAFVSHLLRLPYGFFERRSVGDLSVRLNSNVTVREILTAGVLSALLDGSFALISIALLLIISTNIGLVVLLLAVLQVVIVLSTRGRQQELLAREINAQVLCQGYQYEMLSGLRTLKAMGAEEYAENRWTNHFFEVLNAALDRGQLAVTNEALLNALRVAAPLIILALGAQGVLDHAERLGPMLATTTLATTALVPIAGLVDTAAQIHVLQAYRARLDDVFNSKWEQTASLPDMSTVRGAISLENLSFRYAEHSAPVVDNVSVKVQPGTLVAIVGPSGSGKSTLASLLLGLHSPTEGRVLVDGIDIRHIDLQSFRRQVGYVGQSLNLFAGSIRSNISFGNADVPLAKVARAAELALLADEIAAMPMAYETPLGENASSISGGQAQRVALARALVRDPAVLILDEATSALDARTESHVQASLKKLCCTRIVIAHRLSTVVNADLILVMEGGSIVERGRHEELLTLQGVYANLVRAQLASSHAGGIS